MTPLSAQESPAPLPLRVEPVSRRLLWTRVAIARLEASSLLDTESYELLDGNLLEKMKNRRQTITLRRVRQALLALFAEDHLQSEAPIDVSVDDNETSAPEPDIVVLTRPDEVFLETNPGPRDIALVIEVADATLRRDLGIKAALYARAGIAEYWVIDIEGRKVHAHRESDGETWGNVTVHNDAQAISPRTHPETRIFIQDLLPPAA